MTAEEFARKVGYSGAEYRREWRGFKVYAPTLKENITTPDIGYPYKIMERNGEFRLQSFRECMDYLDECGALDDKEYFGIEYDDEDEGDDE